jgi:cyclopropane fatty-acyl-phospholipid synthase-like methyltransferase
MDRQAWLRERRQTAEERHDTIQAFTYDDQWGEIGMVLESGRRVVGTDQSTGMLARARARFPQVPVERVGLQELAFEGEFDAVMCIDAMENVPPEDWPRVVANLRRPLRPGGRLYLTVEEVDDRELEEAFADATARGLPVVRGELAGEGAGYHHYPSRDQVAGWLAEAGLRVEAQEHSPGDGYGDLHLLARPG